MERFAWKGRIKPGMQAEYKRRHDEIWPEMKELLKSAGIGNYTIWSDGDVLSATMNAKRASPLRKRRRRAARSSTAGTNT